MTVLSKARYALAAIRITNGPIALVAPALIIKRFGDDPDKDVAADYGLRLFGVRTVVIGADLITEQGEPPNRSIGQAVVIHASGTVTAARLGTSGRLRPQMAVAIAAISALNTALAVAAWACGRRVRLPAHPRALHRHVGLHARREGGRRHPLRRPALKGQH